LTHQLIDFLVGDKDGVPKDPNYIYRLYLALKKYEDAAKTALVIARQEQDLGNYGLAHKIVVEIIRHLEDATCKVSLQLRQTFVLLHSYSLVKVWVKRDDHLSAARLLLRVAQHVSKFPMHVVPLLTSTVIECQRAGLKSQSYEYAVMLVRPEYRSMLDPNLKRKIEAIVRRKQAHGEGEIADDMTPCPISTQPLPQYSLECPTTRDALPMCVVTGRHMVLDDWCFCPISKFPALYSEYIRYIQEEATRQHIATEQQMQGQSADGPETSTYERSILRALPVDVLQTLSAPDPIHGKSVTMQDLVLVSAEEAMRYIQRYNNVLEEKKAADKDGGGDGDEGAAAGEGGEDKPKAATKSNAASANDGEDDDAGPRGSRRSGFQDGADSGDGSRRKPSARSGGSTGGSGSGGGSSSKSRRSGDEDGGPSQSRKSSGGEEPVSPVSPRVRRAGGGGSSSGGGRTSSRSRNAGSNQDDYEERGSSSGRSGSVKKRRGGSDGIAAEGF
jgi:hypothetical protein